MKPAAALLMRKTSGSAPPGSGTVTYRGAGALVIETANTTISLPVPGTAIAGDLLVAIVMRRSTAATLPSGWSLASSAGPGANGATNQYTDVYTKTATSGDISAGTVSFGQTSSGRLNGQMLAIYGSLGTPYLESQATGTLSNTPATAINAPIVSAAAAGRFGLICASTTLATGTPTTNTATINPPWTIRSGAAVDLRLGVATYLFSSPGDTSGYALQFDHASLTNGLTANALIFAS